MIYAYAARAKRSRNATAKIAAFRTRWPQEIRGLIIRYAAARDGLRAKALKYAEEEFKNGKTVDARELAAMTYHDNVIKRMKEVKEIYEEA